MSEQMLRVLPDLVSEGLSIIDEVAADLVSGCTEGLDLAQLAADDFLSIRDAALEVSDLMGLVEREKNCIREAAGKLWDQIGGSLPTVSPGAASNP